ncbi:hypothetical protein A3Q56_02137 [Intoshia linei]|uniref:Uncharacterized protein n=1 Tax=Intoshia linei TaxID=1819745 RepID=A0A177B735_9BILA|nr:hypothetical protein A3Q56_02137 [Intoshia linei]
MFEMKYLMIFSVLLMVIHRDLTLPSSLLKRKSGMTHMLRLGKRNFDNEKYENLLDVLSLLHKYSEIFQIYANDKKNLNDEDFNSESLGLMKNDYF